MISNPPTANLVLVTIELVANWLQDLILPLDSDSDGVVLPLMFILFPTSTVKSFPGGHLFCVLKIELTYVNLILMKENNDKKYLTTTELARLLKVSRVAIFKKIKSGKVKGFKIGRNYVIPTEEFLRAAGTFVSENKKSEIDKIVKKAVKEYGETLKRLGEE